jgi:hypothetical protein
MKSNESKILFQPQLPDAAEDSQVWEASVPAPREGDEIRVAI